jgi:hypothetical protein
MAGWTSPQWFCEKSSKTILSSHGQPLSKEFISAQYRTSAMPLSFYGLLSQIIAESQGSQESDKNRNSLHQRMNHFNLAP